LLLAEGENTSDVVLIGNLRKRALPSSGGAEVVLLAVTE